MNPVDLVRRRLEERGRRIVMDRGDEFMAQCPHHSPDRTPSLHVSTGGDGRALLHCFAGCELDDVLYALAIEPSDLFVAAANLSGSDSP